MFDKVLIANRGEIALRIARACRELGIPTVAVYSTEDRDSAVVSFADEAVHIGPAPAKRSYLHIPSIIEAARTTGADAVHPGYGFLSEDPDFAEVCRDNDLVLVGPPPDVLTRLGAKSEARRLMAEAGLPLLPGSTEPLASADEAQRLADRIGYPVIIKASAGGGGRGMRVVTDPGSLAEAYRETRRDAEALFGNPEVYLERFLSTTRHVEVQILADGFGNAIHLGERDCSVQRRHQKLVEESPAPRLPPGLADRMGEAAVRGALAVGYVGAATFEFLVEPGGEFYFMEINCRIQVEHPVTEMVTGVDLVAEQFRIAAGHPLTVTQSEARPRGAAIECRLNVEDPDNDFAPAAGVIEEFRVAGGPFVRVDTHAFTGYRVPVSYDSLLAKLLVWGPDRESALRRMERALGETRIHGPGIKTTTGFLERVVRDRTFRTGEYSTSLVAELTREKTPRTDDRTSDPVGAHT
ncbi:acetyl-CoA carboxylase biotin carboxylase subunit [Saccharomonospora saliphila]|uniref:acetyl-CoA carboxylase biotin carboxylase subunit n=1 Tax=Saccharomonospora saliphila TaxID=369829 RepID=UPI0003776950|nr:acetyl-CoA carboxylase biotin carboxylase subunit [Saccharomonospora saliphila]